MATKDAHVLISGHHASGHQVSEFLQDRQPGSASDFAVKVCGFIGAMPHDCCDVCRESTVRQVDELTVAYGQRAMPKLVEMLALPELDEDCSVKCLKLLISLISSQASCFDSDSCNSIAALPSL